MTDTGRPMILPPLPSTTALQPLPIEATVSLQYLKLHGLYATIMLKMMGTTSADNTTPPSAAVAAAGTSTSQVAPTAPAVAPAVGAAVTAPAVSPVFAITPEEASLGAEIAVFLANLRRPHGLPAIIPATTTSNGLSSSFAERPPSLRADTWPATKKKN